MDSEKCCEKSEKSSLTVSTEPSVPSEKLGVGVQTRSQKNEETVESKINKLMVTSIDDRLSNAECRELIGKINNLRESAEYKLVDPNITSLKGSLTKYLKQLKDKCGDKEKTKTTETGNTGYNLRSKGRIGGARSRKKKHTKKHRKNTRKKSKSMKRIKKLKK